MHASWAELAEQSLLGVDQDADLEESSSDETAPGHPTSQDTPHQSWTQLASSSATEKPTRDRSWDELAGQEEQTLFMNAPMHVGGTTTRERSREGVASSSERNKRRAKISRCSSSSSKASPSRQAGLTYANGLDASMHARTWLSRNALPLLSRATSLAIASTCQRNKLYQKHPLTRFVQDVAATACTDTHADAEGQTM